MASAMGPVGSPPPFGFHDLPEHGVVDVSAGIVANGAADVIGDGAQVFH